MARTNDAVALSRLHVFRTLRAHLADRWGLGLAVVHPSHGALSLLDDQDSPAGQIVRSLEAHASTKQTHTETMAGLPAASGEDVVLHPAGFRVLSVPCIVGGHPGRLAIFPFATEREADSARERLARTLIEAGEPIAEAADVAETLPVLPQPVVDHLRELAQLLAGEAGAFAAEWERSERTIDRIRRRGKGRYSEIIGQSGPMQELFSLMDKVVTSESTVYIHGENGTGKELVAKALHAHSNRQDRPFIVQNCSALNDNLLESELFGHRRGAFTGAVQDKPGLFDLADTGTFFLDEIGDMSAALQVKLLRVLQEGTFTPVGGIEMRRVDVRVICATNRDLRQMVDQGTFREDLFYRINVINLRIPPLRERKDDIPTLVDYFLANAMRQAGQPDGAKRLTEDALQRLVEYDWPGNVRELENEMERLVVLTGPLVRTIGVELLSPRIRTRALDVPQAATEAGLSLPEALLRVERSMIYDALRSNRWNKTRAAEVLGISRRNLIRKVKQFGFEDA